MAMTTEDKTYGKLLPNIINVSKRRSIVISDIRQSQLLKLLLQFSPQITLQARIFLMNPQHHMNRAASQTSQHQNVSCWTLSQVSHFPNVASLTIHSSMQHWTEAGPRHARQ